MPKETDIKVAPESPTKLRLMKEGWGCVYVHGFADQAGPEDKHLKGHEYSKWVKDGETIILHIDHGVEEEILQQKT